MTKTKKNKENQRKTKKNKEKQRKTKKNKEKQRGGMFPSSHRTPPEIIPYTFFETLVTEFRKIEQIVTFDIDRPRSMVTININNKNSFMFYVNGKTLRITQVLKRSNVEITRFIEIIIAVFMRIEYFTRLELGDTSKIVFNHDEIINISLFKMKILETSQTWYERLGFKNDSLDSKREEINGFINKKLIDEIDKSKLPDYSNEIDIDNISVKDFMIFIKYKLKGENTKETITHIRDIVDALYDALTTQVGSINLNTNYINK